MKSQERGNKKKQKQPKGGIKPKSKELTENELDKVTGGTDIIFVHSIDKSKPVLMGNTAAK